MLFCTIRQRLLPYNSFDMSIEFIWFAKHIVSSEPYHITYLYLLTRLNLNNCKVRTLLTYRCNLGKRYLLNLQF